MKKFLKVANKLILWCEIIFQTEGVFCQAEAWRAACLATSATAMVRNLLLGTFDLETLLKSNLNGTKQHVPNLFCPWKKNKSVIFCGINYVCVRAYHRFFTWHFCISLHLKKTWCVYKKTLAFSTFILPPLIIILKYYFQVGSQPEGMGSSWSPLTKLKR